MLIALIISLLNWALRSCHQAATLQKRRDKFGAIYCLDDH